MESEIPKQEKRLKNLKDKEDDELVKIDGKISNLTGKASNLLNGINVNDENSLSSKEIKNKEQADKLKAEADKLKARKTELQKQKAIRGWRSDLIGNTQFKSGTFAGKEIYVVDGNEVSKDEYNRKKAELENQKS